MLEIYLKYKNILVPSISLIIFMIIVSLLVTRIDSCQFKSGIEKQKEEVNSAIHDLKIIQTDVNKDKVDEAVKLEKVRTATSDYLNAVNATDGARVEANKALSDMQNSVNSNRNVNISIQDLEKKLNAID